MLGYSSSISACLICQKISILHHTFIFIVIGNMRYLSLHILSHPSQGVSSSFFFASSWCFIEPSLLLLLSIAPLTALYTLYNPGKRALMSPKPIESPRTGCNLAYRPGQSSRSSGEQTGQNIFNSENILQGDCLVGRANRNLGRKIGTQEDRQEDRQVGEQVEGQVGGQVGEQVGEQVGRYVVGQLG